MSPPRHDEPPALPAPPAVAALAPPAGPPGAPEAPPPPIGSPPPPSSQGMQAPPASPTAPGSSPPPDFARFTIGGPTFDRTPSPTLPLRKLTGPVLEGGRPVAHNLPPPPPAPPVGELASRRALVEAMRRAAANAVLRHRARTG